MNNSTAPQYPELSIEAVQPGGGSATDWRQVQSGRQFVAQTPEVFTHDLDGNLTSDGRWTYEWDAENRLIGMETQPARMQCYGYVFQTYLPCYDGNGNVVRLVRVDDSEVDTLYEYGPFGETVRASGDYAAISSFGRSTKYADIETEMVCYGYRYYKARTGRWLSRDPIGENGGINLYCFIGNRASEGLDPDGRFDVGGFQAAGMLGEDIFGPNWITDIVQDIGSFNDRLEWGLVGTLGRRLSDGSLGNPILEMAGEAKHYYVTAIEVKTAYEVDGAYGFIQLFPNVEQLLENDLSDRESRRAMVNIAGDIGVTLTLRKCLPGGSTQSITQGMFPKLSSAVTGFSVYEKTATVQGVKVFGLVNIRGKRVFAIERHNFGNSPEKRLHFHLGGTPTQRRKHRPYDGGWRSAWEQFKNATWDELFGL